YLAFRVIHTIHQAPPSTPLHRRKPVPTAEVDPGFPHGSSPWAEGPRESDFTAAEACPNLRCPGESRDLPCRSHARLILIVICPRRDRFAREQIGEKHCARCGVGPGFRRDSGRAHIEIVSLLLATNWITISFAGTARRASAESSEWFRALEASMVARLRA